MKRSTKLTYLAVSFLLTGCTIRAVGIIETEDAVYGNTKLEKGQKYDPKHLGFVESIMGTINSDSLEAVGRIVNGEQARPEPTPIAPSITPLTPGNPVIVQP